MSLGFRVESPWDLACRLAGWPRPGPEGVDAPPAPGRTRWEVLVPRAVWAGLFVESVGRAVAAAGDGGGRAWWPTTAAHAAQAVLLVAAVHALGIAYRGLGVRWLTRDARRASGEHGPAGRASGSPAAGARPLRPVIPEAHRMIQTPLDARPNPNEVRDALFVLFGRPYEELYAAALAPGSGSSPEDLHAMGEAWVVARKQFEAGLRTQIVSPVGVLPPWGSYFDHEARLPRYLLEAQPGG